VFDLLSSRYLPDLVVFSLASLLQTGAVVALRREPAVRRRPTLCRAFIPALGVSLLSAAMGFLLRVEAIAHRLPNWCASWVRGLTLMWAFFSILLIAAYAASRLLPRIEPGHSPSRRHFLVSAKTVLLGLPAAAVGYGTFIQRFNLTLREQRIEIPNLPPDLHGLRITQLTDIHLSPFLSVRDLERAVEMANETRPHLMLVTGDLITTENDPLDDCLDRMARLRADAGVFGCMGNHEIYAGTEEYTQRQAARRGMRFLRQESAILRFGAASLNLAGVDYQRRSRPYLAGAERLLAPGAFNVLLSHNPDVFPAAARKGFPLTFSGHTHGGQVQVEILGQNLNVARFFTPYVDGLYHKSNAAIFVSRGIGTIGLPARLGALPEVAAITLVRAAGGDQVS